MDSNFSYRGTRAPNSEVFQASRVAFVPERAMLAAVCVAVIAEAIGRRIEQEGAVDPNARDLVMRGGASVYRPRSPTTLQEAQRAVEQALEIDRRSVDARIGLATTLVVTLGQVWSSSVQHDQVRAEQLLRDALERDPNRSMGRFGMGYLRRLQNRLAESQIELERAIALDPNNALAMLQLGATLKVLRAAKGGNPVHRERDPT